MDSRIREALESVVDKLEDCDQATALEIARKALSLLSAEPEPCEDGEATLKFAIFDGIANSFGKSPEQIRDAIYKNITSPELRWALDALSSHCEQEAMADERRRGEGDNRTDRGPTDRAGGGPTAFRHGCGGKSGPLRERSGIGGRDFS